jgi:hypothetical protein
MSQRGEGCGEGSGDPVMTKLPAGIVEASPATYKYRLSAYEWGGYLARMLVDKYRHVRPVDFCLQFSADAVDQLVRERVYVTVLPVSEFADPEVAYRILRGLGLIEIFYWKGPWRTELARYSVLTPLGALFKDLVGGDKTPSTLLVDALVYSSLVFTTKARIVFDLYHSHHLDTRKFYETVKSRLFGGPVKRLGRAYYEGAERPAFEILHEMTMTRGGTSDRFVSETEILLMFLESFRKANYTKRQFVNIFEALNRRFRYKHRDRFIYGAGAWEALEAADRIDLDKLIGPRILEYLQPVFERLDREFANIESILQCIYGLPQKL